ncbi:MAG: glycosyl hydrolase family 95 catalytic domain-containing protein [Candidatus Merdivicinus sp.]|jgi:alpha-L-fucosidase 2
MERTSSINWKEFLSRQDPVWEELPTAWDEGIFLGNGMTGALIFWDTEKHMLRLELCRSDITDRRDPNEMPVAFSRARLKIGYFSLKPPTVVTGGNMRLDLYHARGEGVLHTQEGDLRFWCIVPRGEDAIIFHWEEDTIQKCEWKFTPHPAISPRQEWGIVHNEPKRMWNPYPENPAPEIREENDITICTQPLLNGDSYVTAWKNSGNECVISITNSFSGSNPQTESLQIITRCTAEREKVLSQHEKWWESFYQKSFISLPDPQFENFYWIQLYKFASASRKNGIVIDNQGPWLWDTAWPYSTWNLNVQLTYWLCCASGHTDLGMPLIQDLHKNLDNLIAAVPEKYRNDSAAIGTAASPECFSEVGDPLECGGHAEIANLVWALHNCWLLYRYSMDSTIAERMYPILMRAVTFLTHFLTEDENGVLHFAPSASPEYPNGVPADCNYTLALFRWGVSALQELEKILRTSSEQTVRYRAMVDRLCDYPGDCEQGFYIGKDMPYQESHRHYSHLLMIYPLKLLDLSVPENREMAERSLLHWQSMPEKLRGYSCTGAASISAMLGNGNEALRYLTGLWEEFLRPNTLYKESGPVIETPLSAAQSILDMLIQSIPQEIKVFPAVPDAWQDCCFDHLLADGNISVSAVRRNGNTIRVSLSSPISQSLTLYAVFGEKFCVSCPEGSSVVRLSENTFAVSLAAGQEISICAADIPEKDMEIEPCQYTGGKSGNCYGINSASHEIMNFTRTDFDLL